MGIRLGRNLRPWAALVLFAGAANFVPASSADAAEPPIDFNRQVRSLLSNRCFRCHGPDEEARQAGLRLDVREAAIAETESGAKAIVPGKPAESELIARIVSTDDDQRMPPRDAGEPLKPAEVEVLQRWIAEGASYAKHWAYVAPVQAALPAVSNAAWVKNPIDRFALARLDAEKLKPGPEADRYTLIRRASLDLTGLPPTIAEVDAFVADQSPDAYEKLIDRLLKSPAYGERWAQVWLDLARYADSAGYAQDPPRTIWRYRDWVIGAYNRNLPFDQFTIEQIAGDMLPNASDEQLLATAFHRNTMTNSEGGTDDEEWRNAAIVDRVNTTMEVWMGLTMACAQCHTHKYDPVTQEEYFRFFALLNQSEDADRGDESPLLMTMTPEIEKQRTEFTAQLAAAEKELAETTQAATAGKPGAAKTGPLAARFVRVELPGQGVYLSLAEVQAFAGDKNLSAAGKASQISTAFDGPANLANDGNTNGIYYEGKSVTHTNAANDPWWEVDLGSPQSLDRVVVWNRTDPSTPERLKGYRVVLLDEARQPLLVVSPAGIPQPSTAVEVPKTLEALTDTHRAELAKYTGTPEVAAAQKKVEELKKQLAAAQGIPTPIMRELAADKRRKTHIQLRGNFLDKAAEVSPGVPAVFHPLPSGVEANRLELARWLVARDNPLTARVVVNRYWEHLFGVGLVETSEDFGVQGERPSHPELLDWLAVDLMEHGWDIKRLLKQIVTSATYRQSSQVSAELQARDPHNRLLARGPRFRNSAEMVRDQALAIAGLLSPKMLGPSVQPPRPMLGLNSAFGGSTDWQTSAGEDKFRRGLYTSWRRTTPYPSMTTFDAPSREFCMIRRMPTNTPLQALVVLNDPVYVEAAQALARRMVTQGGASAQERVTYGFRLAVARPPQEKERTRLVALFESAHQQYKSSEAEAVKFATDPIGPLPAGLNAPELAAWTLVANVLLNLDEVISKR